MNATTLRVRAYECDSLGHVNNAVSHLIKVERVRGIWVHEMFRRGPSTLLMRDYSTGAFMDWEGNIKPALAPMMDALMRGE